MWYHKGQWHIPDAYPRSAGVCGQGVKCVVYMGSLNHTRLQHWSLGWKDINLKTGNTYWDWARIYCSIQQIHALHCYELHFEFCSLQAISSSEPRRVSTLNINPTRLCPKSNVLNLICSIFQTTEVETFSNAEICCKILDDLMINKSWDIDQGIWLVPSNL